MHTSPLVFTEALSCSEWHVADLVASGMTNKEVSATLFISPKTVESHLGRIYRKLGIRSRGALGRRIDQLTEKPACGAGCARSGHFGRQSVSA